MKGNSWKHCGYTNYKQFCPICGEKRPTPIIIPPPIQTALDHIFIMKRQVKSLRARAQNQNDELIHVINMMEDDIPERDFLDLSNQKTFLVTNIENLCLTANRLESVSNAFLSLIPKEYQ
jgi:hypothetical protein